MFKYNIRGENIEVTEAIRQYAEKKISKLEKYFTDVANATVYVNLKVYAEKTAKVEVTIPLPYLVLRAEETSIDLYGSIDLVVDKLERQVRKHKTKINRKGREKGFVNENLLTSELEDVEEPSVNLGKVKQLKVEVMTREEAVFQMELLGHDFFAFLDDKTGEVSIVYKRRDTGYGVLEISK